MHTTETMGEGSKICLRVPIDLDNLNKGIHWDLAHVGGWGAVGVKVAKKFVYVVRGFSEKISSIISVKNKFDSSVCHHLFQVFDDISVFV